MKSIKKKQKAENLRATHRRNMNGRSTELRSCELRAMELWIVGLNSADLKPFGPEAMALVAVASRLSGNKNKSMLDDEFFCLIFFPLSV
jgi:hypothetical protein